MRAINDCHDSAFLGCADVPSCERAWLSQRVVRAMADAEEAQPLLLRAGGEAGEAVRGHARAEPRML